MSSFRIALMGLAVGAALVGTSTGPAAARPLDRDLSKQMVVAADPVQTLKNKATQRCLDDSGKGLRTLGCNNLSTQKWQIHVWNDQTRQLRSVGTGECLDDSSNGLRTISCWPSSNPNSKLQSWKKATYSDGTIRLQNQGTGRCLDDSSKGLRTMPCWSDSSKYRAYQSWS
ncbi:RICIN domain-containing protein [Kribbella kalugense]|uniref:Ricin-type beta-trefoil lectin protein n=1 Tax=Kribbella kalugense TaxID=2512221 RepID=A0A4R7ZEE7_9ACTN|nr:RICIN domain-containing protein [Kribbella kalugense]TDW15632.1 ricin-type beta-trefoil lectin protein [Kribbella kalugense]